MAKPKYLKHFLETDPILHQAIVEGKLVLQPLTPQTDATQFFSSLCQSIISQQLAGKAADAIIARFKHLFPNDDITPEQVIALDEQTMRDVGMSWAKVRSVKDLAAHTVAGKIRYELFATMSEEEIISELIQVKGIGRWTAEMFLIFTLGKEDVFSFGDLGLKNGFKQVYGLSESDAKKVLEKMKQVTASWSPYRSYGALAMWRVLDQKQ